MQEMILVKLNFSVVQIEYVILNVTLEYKDWCILLLKTYLLKPTNFFGLQFCISQESYSYLCYLLFLKVDN